MDADSIRRSKLHKMRKWQIRTKMKGSAESNIQKALLELDIIITSLGVSPQIGNLAMILFRKVQSIGLASSRSARGMIAACVYAACRIRKEPLLLSEVAHQAEVPMKRVAHFY